MANGVERHDVIFLWEESHETLCQFASPTLFGSNFCVPRLLPAFMSDRTYWRKNDHRVDVCCRAYCRISWLQFALVTLVTRSRGDLSVSALPSE